MYESYNRIFPFLLFGCCTIVVNILYQHMCQPHKLLQLIIFLNNFSNKKISYVLVHMFIFVIFQPSGIFSPFAWKKKKWALPVV